MDSGRGYKALPAAGAHWTRKGWEAAAQHGRVPSAPTGASHPGPREETQPASCGLSRMTRGLRTSLPPRSRAGPSPLGPREVGVGTACPPPLPPRNLGLLREPERLIRKSCQ